MDNKTENNLKKRVETPNGVSLKESIAIRDKEQLEKISTTGEARQLVEQLPGVETAHEQESTGFSEDEASYKGTGTAGPSGSKTVSPVTSVYVHPSIPEMIKQTVMAIEMELKKNEGEMKSLLRNQNTSYYLINDKAKEIRFLNGILFQLKKAARLAEDFIVGLWKQYVKRA